VRGLLDERGGVRSGPGAARTILLFHIISAGRPRVVPNTKLCAWGEEDSEEHVL